jgi:putative molybdopterin biosynthesis protein
MSRRRYYLEDIPLEEAERRFAAALAAAGGLRPTPAETLPLAQAAGRVTAAPLWARISAPHYHAAAMDGIAVRAADTVGATEATPLRLAEGSTARWVDTGDALPAEADAVIMAEHVQEAGAGALEIRAAAAPWQHVRPLGEDIVATELVLGEGQTLRPYDLAAAAAAGHTAIAVRRRPRVLIIPTGSELVPPERADALRPGEIIEFNSLMLAAQVEEWGGEAARHPPLPDRREDLRAAIERGLADHDIVVVNAGSSAGSEDYTAEVLAGLGQVAVHGCAIRPGHPVILAVAAGKPALGLPGYPVSAAITAELFLRPLVYRMAGQEPPARPAVEAIVTRKLLSPMGEDEFVRVTLGRVGDRLVATPLTRGAGVIMSLVRADGIMRIARFSEGLHAGAPARVELLRGMAEVEATIVAIGSHDLALDLLAGHLRRHGGAARLSSANVGSLGGLIALRRGDAHLAGVHLLDEATGEYNRSFVARHLPDDDVLLVHLAMRAQGLILPRGNPRGIGALADLARPGLRFANRQRGSGTRVLLDYHLARHSIDPAGIAGYEREELTHMAVAAAVLSGAADVGLGIQAAASALGLDFVPLFQERYDLAAPRRHWEAPLLAPLRAALASPDYRAAVAALGGYEVSRMGELM